MANAIRHKLTPEEKKERRRKQREEWKSEVIRLRQQQIQKEQEDNRRKEPAGRNAKALYTLLERLGSDEFSAWYEATTGEDSGEFIRFMLRPVSDFDLTMAGGDKDLAIIERIQYAVETITENNPWTNPERRVQWAEEVANASPGRERRSILIRLATPRWANREAMIAIYRERARISRETGVVHHVDHIVPIVSQKVCGLHCEANLRIIPAAENMAKSNKFCVDKWGM